MTELSGIDRIVYGVEDLVLCRRYFDDWGLTLVSASDNKVLFETLEKSQIELRHIDDASLPPAIEDGSSVGEVIWGAGTEEGLRRFVDRISTGVEVSLSDGLYRCTDANGLSIGFHDPRIN